jgi:curli biogenesis system outer membrane secretion channel CsgG
MSAKRVACRAGLCLVALVVAAGCADRRGEATSQSASPGLATAAPSDVAAAVTSDATSREEVADAEDRTSVEKASLAVLDFTFHSSLRPETHREFNSGLLTDRVVTALARARKFRLVERQRVSDLLREIELGEQGFTSKRHAIRAGEMVGADYLVMGSIHRMGASAKTEQVPYTKETTTITSGSIAGNIRVTDSRRGEIVASWPIEAKRTQRGNSATGSGDLLETLQSEFADRVARAIVDSVYPVKVASVGEDGRLFLNAGEGRGLAMGDVVSLSHPGKPIVDPDTGEVLGREEARVGTARIVEVRQRLLVARLLKSSGAIAPGYLVRSLDSEDGEVGGIGAAPAAERVQLDW